jgi:streptogrisin D
LKRANPPTGRRMVLGTLVAASVIALPIVFAGTSSADSTADPAATADLAADLQGRLGTRAAGAYADSSGRLVVNVTDATAAAQVRRAGAKARIVAHSAATLDAATDVLDRTAAIAGTSWKVDPVTNQVVVEADSTVTGAKRARLEKAVAGLGGAARIDRVAGTVRPTTSAWSATTPGRTRPAPSA